MCGYGCQDAVVVDDRTESDDTPDGQDDAWRELTSWERASASIAGVLMAAAGTASVFLSDNQAGSAVLVVVSAVLLLIGIQGTPLSRFGAGDNSAKFERGRVVGKLLEKGRHQADSEAARAYVDAASQIAPGIENSVQARSLLYETEVKLALQHVMGPTKVVSRDDRLGDDGLDFTIRTGPTGRVDVIVKYTHRHGTAGRWMFDLLAKGRSRMVPWLLVVNETSDAAVEEVRSRIANDEGLRGRVEIVVWRGPQDNGQLKAAIDRLRFDELPRD